MLMKGKFMGKSHLIVIGIMGRSNFDHSCPKFRIDMVVGNDRDLRVRQGQHHRFAYQDECSVDLLGRQQRQYRQASFPDES